MIKLYIDDGRTAPEGWKQVFNIHEALEFIKENYADISHIDFDYYLSHDMPGHNGSRLIRELLNYEEFEGIKVFHMPIENYTFHSSDSSMNDVMRTQLEKAFGVYVPPKKMKSEKSSLRLLLNNKKRR